MFKLLKSFKKKDWLIVLVSFVLIYAQVWLELKMPDYMSEITVLVQTEGSKMSAIIENGAKMLSCAFGSLLFAIIVGYFFANLSARFSLLTRKKIFTKVEDLGMEEIKDFSVSSLITRTTNDITQVEMFIAMGLQLLIKAPITAVWAVTKILNKSWIWSSATALSVLILLIVIALLTIIVMPKFKIVQKLTDKLNSITRENLNGIRVIRAFNAEDYQENKFSETNDALTKQQLFNQKTFAIMSPIMYLVMNGLALAIYYIGAFLIDEAALADKIDIFGNMIVFSSYAMQVIMAFLMLAMIFMMFPRASVSAKRINEVLDKSISIQDGNYDANNITEKGTVEFKNVSFKYPDAEEYVLENISFKANRGETIAFIGSTGSGKSTLIDLIPRFYDATEGVVYVDGVDVKEYKLKDLRDRIGYISQKAVIFSGDILSNVNLGIEEYDLEESKEAIEVAEAKEFVEKLDDTYNAHVAQRGTNLSGGQKQRLSIARAVNKDPEIFIFDDSFSALDFKTESRLKKALNNKLDNRTKLIVGQRIGTIMDADKILVIDDGKCVGMGTHKELLKNCEVYKEIALSQLSKEEL